MKHLYVLLTLGALLPFACSGGSGPAEPTAAGGPYFGQSPPGDDPELFMFGSVTTLAEEYCISFLQNGRVCVFGRDDMGVSYTYLRNGQWTQPRAMDLDITMGEWKHNAGPDDRTLYFMSPRPTDADDTKADMNIYRLRWTGSGWSEEELLPFPPNSEAYHEIYTSLAANGSAYFHGGELRNAPQGNDDIYRSRCVGGVYQEQERLGEPISTRYGEYDAFVAPDERYLLFGSNRPGGFGSYDSYICFRRDDGSWSHPVNLGERLNSRSWENRVTVTRDGKYMFFVSGRAHELLSDELEDGKWTSVTGFYWVKTGFIPRLRAWMLPSECASELVWMEYREHGIEAALGKLVDLKGQGASYHFLPYEFLMLCGQMIEAGDLDDAERLYQELLKTMGEPYRIRRGYGMICTLEGYTDRGLELLKEAMSDSPVEFMLTVSSLGADLLGRSMTAAALKVMEFNIREHPEHHVPYLGLARAYERSGDTEQARRWCEEALRLRPDYEAAAMMLRGLQEEKR
jgi:tetratricopeptide (TPR) repeat protein